MLLNCVVGEDSWESLGLQGDQISQSWRKSVMNIHWKDWCWSWSSKFWPPDAKNWLIWKDPEAGQDWRQKEKGKQKMNCWMASLTWWTWVWASSRGWWWKGRPGVLQSMGSQIVGHSWVSELKRCGGGIQESIRRPSSFLVHSNSVCCKINAEE